MNLSHPWWEPIRSDLNELLRLPEPQSRLDWLNEKAKERACLNGRGQGIEFVDQAKWPGRHYEDWINQHAQVPTRLSGKGQWHDLFNALVWLRWPLSKAQLNRMHALSSPAGAGSRGLMRDRATLIDEQSLIWVDCDSRLTQALCRRDWKALFITQRNRWQASGQSQGLFIFGHALFEKCMAPYKALTAHVLLISAPDVPDLRPDPQDQVIEAPFEVLASSLSGDSVGQWLDASLANKLRVWTDAMADIRDRQEPADCAENSAIAPGDARATAVADQAQAFKRQGKLFPLPVLGVPGWHEDNLWEGFYDDSQVFR